MLRYIQLFSKCYNSNATYATRQTIMYSHDMISTYNNRCTLGAKLKKKRYPKMNMSYHWKQQKMPNISIFRRRNFIKFYKLRESYTRRELTSRNVSAGKMATETNADALYRSRSRTVARVSLSSHRANFRMLSFEWL